MSIGLSASWLRLENRTPSNFIVAVPSLLLESARCPALIDTTGFVLAHDNETARM